MSNTEEYIKHKSIQKVRTFFVTFITGSATVITIISGWHETKEWLIQMLGYILSLILVYVNLIFLPYAIMVIVGSFIGYATQKYRENIGTHKIPCKFINLFYYKIANRNNKLLKSIHKDIYHNFYKLRDDIHMHRIQSLEEAEKRIEDLLYDIHVAIMRSFGLDMTINIKMLIMDRDNNLCLVPFKHFRNIAERRITSPRAFNYCYYIEPDEYDSLSRYATKAQQYHNQDSMNRRYKVNSIFTYLITKKKRYWMSNDLTLDEKMGDFYTSSDNYPKFYKSMAAFSLIPPDCGKLPEGIVIFDTKKKGVFSEEECVYLFGFIAHLFYELIIEYNHYEPKN